MIVTVRLEEDETWPEIKGDPHCWSIGPYYMEFRLYGTEAEKVFKILCERRGR